MSTETKKHSIRIRLSMWWHGDDDIDFIMRCVYNIIRNHVKKGRHPLFISSEVYNLIKPHFNEEMASGVRALAYTLMKHPMSEKSFMEIWKNIKSASMQEDGIHAANDI